MSTLREDDERKCIQFIKILIGNSNVNVEQFSKNALGVPSSFPEEISVIMAKSEITVTQTLPN